MASFGAVLLPAAPASAATGDIGYADQLYTGASNPPTADKPQSKLWYNDGLWWADMFDATSKTWHIFRLDRSTEKWVDTGTQVDNRPQASADALWDGTTLYIGTQYVTVSDDTTTRPSQNQQARLYRYSYNSSTKTYSPIGSPSVISTNSSESLTIDKDTTGRIWATWTKVSGSSSAGYTSKVYINSSADGSTWGTPAVIPATGSSVAPDDISGLVAFGKNTSSKAVGVLWSNHIDNSVYWATHKDGDPVGTWKSGTAVHGNKQADDHLNLKTIDADAQGRVVAAVKTSLDELSTSASTDPQINVLVFKPGTGSWTSTKFGSLADCHTRPLVMLDSTNNEVHVFATAPTSSGCSYAGQPGTIYEKTTSLDSPSFASGRGTPVIRDAASANMNNVTSMKQSVTSASGLVVLASNNTTKRYWHADETLRGGTTPPTAPTASFTASPTSGTAPLTTSFSDTSTGSPTTRAWDFGNGVTSTAQNPTTTYSAPGTYTVTLTVSNAAGSSSATKTITVASGGGTTTRTVTLTPDADTMVQQASPSVTSGSATTLKADQQDVSGNASSAINSYLRFTVPALGAGESITAAKLSVYATNGSPDGPAVYPTSTSWTESTMTWSSGRPARSSSTAAGNFGAMSTTGTRYSTAVSGVTAAGAVSFELAPDSTDGLDFPSRENTTTANRPQLVLTITTS